MVTRVGGSSAPPKVSTFNSMEAGRQWRPTQHQAEGTRRPYLWRLPSSGPSNSTRHETRKLGYWHSLSWNFAVMVCIAR